MGGITGIGAGTGTGTGNCNLRSVSAAVAPTLAILGSIGRSTTGSATKKIVDKSCLQKFHFVLCLYLPFATFAAGG